mmetsp:Transcript_22811/g.57891  ORF Transcript_22811/g.57891 Transcript_22811/m.57891 type:complete len:89 (-) Transcript_22811:67-333(-)
MLAKQLALVENGGKLFLDAPVRLHRGDAQPLGRHTQQRLVQRGYKPAEHAAAVHPACLACTKLLPWPRPSPVDGSRRAPELLPWPSPP